MNPKISQQIAELLNRRNNLPIKLSRYDIERGGYFYLTYKEGDEEKLISCVQARKMSFFVYELKHLAVSEDFCGQGLGKKMVEIVEKNALYNKVPLIMGTTQKSNLAINSIFSKFGYDIVNEFKNTKTQHTCLIWQKKIKI